MEDYMGKKLEDVIVTLPFADGTEVECGVFAFFEIGAKAYFALLPRTAEGKLDNTKSYMLYEVQKDAEGNPIVLYIEDDMEYNAAAQYFSEHFLK